MMASGVPSYFFVHMPKTGGNSLTEIMEKMAAPCNDMVSCVNTLHMHHSSTCLVAGCEAQRSGQVRGYFDKMRAEPELLLLLRNPRDHVVSMYAHCQQPGAKGYERHHYRPISLEAWLDLWARGPGDEAEEYCGYDPRDVMTRALLDDDNIQNVSHAIDLLEHKTAWVGILEYLPQSHCLLKRLLVDDHLEAKNKDDAGSTPQWENLKDATPLGDKIILDIIESQCHCDHAKTTTTPPSSHLPHHSWGTNTSSFHLTVDMLKTMDALSRSDWLLYSAAVARLRRDLQQAGLGCLLPRL